MSGIDTWRDLPDGVTGQQIRHRKTFVSTEGEPYRLGGGSFYAIVAETKEWVIYEVWSGLDGQSYGEFIASKAEFEREFERKEG